MKLQKVLVSIDVEAPIGDEGVEKLIYGKSGESEYGINYIMDILDSLEIKGLFFVDIAEAWEYGEDAIRDILLTISRRGHSVGVHLHPDRMNDKTRKYLWQYTYEEQYEMIKKCTEFYIDTLKKRPISFRAGRYGADNNTLDILNELQYKIDMSMYYGMRKRCHISDRYETVNSIKCIQNIIEVPVTVFKSFDLFGYKRFDKIDESMPFGEFKYALGKAKKEQSVSVVSFFMHSFSLLNWRSNPDKPVFNKKNELRIKKMLEYCKQNGYQFIGEKSCLETSVLEATNKKILNTSKGIKGIGYAIIRAFKIVKEKMIRNI